MPNISSKRRLAGRIVSALPVLFLAMDSAIKLLQIGPVTESMQHLGYPPGLAFAIGAVELACLVLYVVPRTTVVGAILLTGFLGGAVATHVRIGDPLLTHVLFPTYVALLLWAGLLLRDARVGFILPRPAHS